MEEISAFAAYNVAGGNKKKKIIKRASKIKETVTTTPKKNMKKVNASKNKLIKELAEEISRDLNKNKKNKKEMNEASSTSMNNNNQVPPRNVQEENVEEATTNIKSKEPVVKLKGVKRLQSKANKKTKSEKISDTILSNEKEKISTPKTNNISPSKLTPTSKCKSEPQTPRIYTAPMNDSIQDGLNMFKYLLSPVEINRFFEQFWEKEPCLVQRNLPNYFSNLISFEAIDKMLLKNHVEFTKHIDITSYENGIRQTLNPEGRALPGTVWDFYESGCSIRLLNPQIFIPDIYTMNTTLQEYFHCMVGANVYLTPPSSQGFAPHYDDIEAFILQIEGKKRWKLYSPRNIKEALPRVSSKNFNQDEIGEPILDKILKPGDILYFPRGTIHQARTEGHNHSLHITISLYQRNSYADLLEILFPLMLSKAIDENIDLRRGLPLNIWHNLGVVHCDTRSKDRDEILQKFTSLLQNAIKQMPIDDAVDQMAKKFQHDALPPELTSVEHERTLLAIKFSLNKNGMPDCNLKINDKTKIRLLRANILRLVEEEDKIHIYFYADNSREYHEYDPNFLEISPEDAPTVELLIKCYPEYVAIKNLPIDDVEHRINVVQGLFDRGLLMLEKPINE